MSEEIFGPVLPVVSVDSVEAACAFIRERPSRWRSTCSPDRASPRSTCLTTPHPEVCASTM